MKFLPLPHFKQTKDDQRKLTISNFKHAVNANQIVGNLLKFQFLKQRSRQCVNGNPGDIGCEGPTSESRPCNSFPCSSYSEWTQYSPCTASCNGGTTTRTRECNILPGVSEGPWNIIVFIVSSLLFWKTRIIELIFNVSSLEIKI